MPFTEQQRRSLAAKLKHRHVKTRANQGATISYVEGWHVIAEANRIFGYDCWDRRTLSPRCVWSENQRSQAAALYTAKVQITVRAGGEVITREGIGTGFGRGPSSEAAHEIALKAAETDATKRALATFGNPFGLALYDKDQAGVTRPLRPNPGRRPLFVLQRADEDEEKFATPGAFTDAALASIRAIDNLDALYVFWQRNREALAELRAAQGPAGGQAEAIILALKARARVLGAPAPTKVGSKDSVRAERQSELAFPKEKRLRNKDHLKFVARQPCLICGRKPTHAHHVRFAQSRALGLKVSDEFTVPLCSVHHDAVHRTGNERAWWLAQAIDPLKAAAELWAISQGRAPERASEDASQGVTDAAPSEQAASTANGGQDKPNPQRPGS